MPIQITIVMHENGQLQINGPTNNLLLCFGMLEAAKLGFIDQAKAAENRVQPVNGPVQLPPPPGIPR